MSNDAAPLYTLERRNHGWLALAPGDADSLPVTYFTEIAKLFPKDFVMLPGVAHHFKASGKRNTVLALCAKSDAKKWVATIEESLKGLDPHTQWWRGCEVGRSSAAIFGALAPAGFGREAKENSRGDIPRDADDFQRCIGLLERFPDWRQRLPEVAVTYPGSKWEKLVPLWDEVTAALPERKYEILSRL